MVIPNFEPFRGQHCETTATGCLLKQLGIAYSEPMLFGLGEGLGYIFWRMKTMDFPFIGGRIKTDLLTANICRNLRLQLKVQETTSLKKAWSNIATPLAEGQVVGLKLDCFHLDYFSNKIHFAGHYVAMYGFDEQFAYLIDTEQQGHRVKTTLESLQHARSEKGPMSSRNLSFTIAREEDLPDLNLTIRQAIFNNAKDYLNPPIRNFAYQGIHKTAHEIKKWFHSSTDIKTEFQTAATLMEKAGTGGALFRNLFRDFLLESAERLGNADIRRGFESFKMIALRWQEIAYLFDKVGETQDVRYLDQASDILLQLAELERLAMEKLYSACE